MLFGPPVQRTGQQLMETGFAIRIVLGSANQNERLIVNRCCPESPPMVLVLPTFELIHLYDCTLKVTLRPVCFLLGATVLGLLVQVFG